MFMATVGDGGSAVFPPARATGSGRQVMVMAAENEHVK